MYKLLKLAFKVEDVANKESSDYLMSLCDSASFYTFGNIILVYAKIEEITDTNILKEYPVIDFNFNISELSKINEQEEISLKIKNGETTPFEVM